MKPCIKCNITQPLNRFTKDREYKDGYRNKCINCKNATCREKYQELREIGKLPPQSKILKGVSRREYFNQYSKTWRKNNKDKLELYYTRKRDSGKLAHYNHLTSSRKRNLVRDMTVSEWKCTLSEFNHMCAYCGAGGELHKEHVIPSFHGGGYTKKNIIPSCPSCNYSKKAKDLYEWYGNRESFSYERLLKIYRFIS